MSSVYVNDSDVIRLQRALKKLGTTTLKEMNQVAAETIRFSTRQRFRDGVSPEGKPWKRSLRAGGSGKTLIDTARLRNSLHSRVTDKGFEVGTNVVYASRHQFGDKTPITIRAKTAKGLRFKIGDRWIAKQQVQVQMPARPFLGISDEDKKEIKNLMDDIVREHMK